MKFLYTLLLAMLFLGCSKDCREEEYTGKGEPAWLAEKKAEYAACTCLVEIREGVWNNGPIIEIRIVDPRCNGVNVVYNREGVVLLTSNDQAAYNQYLAQLKEAKLLWRCS